MIVYTFNPSLTILSGVSADTLRLWLAQAQQAYADLMMGGKPISVSYDGQSVTYSAMDLPRIEGFIYLLQRQLGLSVGRRAIRPIFR